MMSHQFIRAVICCGLILTVAPRVHSATDSAQVRVNAAQTQGAGGATSPERLPSDPNVYEGVFKSVFLLFMLAAVLESALAIVFNWRPFVETFNARAVRPLVSFLAAFLFVHRFQLDLITKMVNVANGDHAPPSLAGEIFTALVLAGGSAGVNNLLVTLGYRQQRSPEAVTPKPPPDKAWIAVRLNRQFAVGAVQVFVGARPAGGLPPLVGVIRGASKPSRRFFLNDSGRFPGYGGHAVPANTEVSVELMGVDDKNVQLRKAWGPFVVAGGAIVDLEFDM